MIDKFIEGVLLGANGVLVAAIIIFIIVIFRKYFILCKNVNELNSYILNYDKIDAHDIRIALLTGKQEEMYNKIIDRLYILLALNYEKKSNRKFLERKIAMAESLCSLLGKDLPPQLRSLQSYRIFLEKTDVIGDRSI